jgi:hypothetical protein
VSVDPSMMGAPPAGMAEQPEEPVVLNTEPEDEILNAMAVNAKKSASAGTAADAHEFAQAVNSLASAIAALAKAGELDEHAGNLAETDPNAQQGGDAE